MAAVNDIDFQSLAENSADILCSAGMDGLLHYVSPAALEVLGLEPAEMVGKTLYDFVLPEDHPVVAGAFAVQDQNATFRMRKKDGSEAWIENQIAALGRVELRRELKRRIVDDGRLSPRGNLAEDLPDG